MALSDITFDTSIIVVNSKQSFTVRGICADDLQFILSRHPTELQVMINQFMQLASDKLDNDSALAEFLKDFLPTVATSFGPLAQSIIACASDDTGEKALAVTKRLPLPVQIDALFEIFRMTFEEPTGVKKLLAALNSKLPTSR